MTGNRDDRPMDDEEEAALDLLLRKALGREVDDEGFVRPGFESVDAYLLSTASEEQKETMRAALAASRAFRDEILLLSEDLVRIEEAETARRFDDAFVDPAKSAPAESLPRSGTRLDRSRDRPGSSGFLLSAIGKLAHHPGLGYAATAVLLVVLAYMTFSDRAPGPPPPPGPRGADGARSAARLLAVDLGYETRLRGLGDNAREEADVREIAIPAGTDELMLRLRIDPVEGDGSGSYRVEILEEETAILVLTRGRADLLHGGVLPIVIDVPRMRDGDVAGAFDSGSYIARVTYAGAGHPLDQVVLLESRFRLHFQSPEATKPPQ